MAYTWKRSIFNKRNDLVEMYCRQIDFVAFLIYCSINSSYKKKQLQVKIQIKKIII